MKFRIQLALTVLAALAVMAAACSPTPSVDHYPTFVQAMDHLVGPGNWSAQSHASGKDDLLTVSGLTIKLPGLKTAAEPAEQPVLTGSDGTAETSPPPAVATGEQQVVEIAAVEIKKPLDQKTLETLLAAADWKNQKETKLADSVVLKGISQKIAVTGDIVELKIEEASVRAVALSASGADAPAGRAGFLKALRLSDLGYKNFTISSKSREADVKIGIGQVAVGGVAFDGEMLPGLETMDPSGLSGVMSAMTAKSATINDASMDIQDDKFKIRLSAPLVTEKDIKAMGAIGEMNLEGFKFELTDEKNNPTTLSLAKLSLRGFDMSAYMRKMMPVALAASLDPGQADQMMLNLYTLGDIFVAPFSLDEISFSGLDINIAGLIGVKMAEASATGPYRAGQLPVSQKSSLKGLEIILPEDPAKIAQEPDLQSLFDFGQKFGMTRFVIDIEGEGSYDAQSGQLVNRLNRLTIKDLLEISGSGEIGGLTPERLAKLNSTPLSMAKMALIVPDEIFGDAAFHNLNIKLTDQGLTNRLMAYAALAASESSGSKVSAEDIRQQVLATAPMLIAMQGSGILADPDTLAQSLIAFLREPGSLELKLTAQPPLGVKSVLEMGLDPNRVLNSLNMNLSANGQEAPPLKFVIPN